jgi:hypothetical protein
MFKLRGPLYGTSRAIVIVGGAVFIAAIMLFLSRPKPLPCNRIFVFNSLHPANNEEKRRIRGNPPPESGLGCP